MRMEMGGAMREIRREAFEGSGPGGLFLFADALDGLRALKEEGVSPRLIYMDPPFLTGKRRAEYRDDMPRGELLAILDKAARLCREMLKPDGSLYLHVDHRLSAHCRLLLDDIFGENCFLNEIIWAYKSGGRSLTHFSRKHDTILLYGMCPKPYFNPGAVALPRESGNHMKRRTDETGRSYRSIRSGGKEYRYYDDEGVPPSDVWTDISHLQQRDPERTGYPTQKPLALLKRMVLASSEAGDTVLDPFCGSGTTLAAALDEGRQGITIDASEHSLATVRKRFVGMRMEYRYLKEATPK